MELDDKHNILNCQHFEKNSQDYNWKLDDVK